MARYGKATERQTTNTTQNLAEEKAHTRTLPTHEVSLAEAQSIRPRDYQLSEKAWAWLKTTEDWATNPYNPTLADILLACEATGEALELRDLSNGGCYDYVLVLAEETKAEDTSAKESEATETTETKTKKTTKKASKKSETKNEQTNKEEKEMATTTNRMGTRANRVVVRTEQDGYVAEFFKTHKSIAVVASEDTNWVRQKDHNPTQAREDFRTWVQAHSSEFGVAWIPEYQAQAWERKYWKYETDEQVEEDAITLMAWTIRSICEKVGLDVEMGKMALDSIVPMESPLSYVEHGKYTKNGNWAVAQVNLDVTATIEGTEINIIYPIEMRSGQLTKIKLTKEEIKAMVEDSKVA